MDFEEYLANLKLSPFTKKSYLYAYNKLNNSGLFERPIETTGEDVIIKIIQQMTDNPNTASALLNVCLLIKKENNKPYENLVKFRDQLKGLIERHHNAKNSTISLPSYNDLIKHMNDAYLQKDYLKYMINYLLIHYGVRNKDLNCLIVRDKRDAMGEDNYLVVLKSRVLFIRNNYKTVAKYGRKQITIINRRFYSSLSALLCGKAVIPLLLNAKGERIPEGSLGTLIQSNTLDEIGEGNIAKILMLHYAGDYEKLRELSNYRGTDAGTLIQRYNILKA